MPTFSKEYNPIVGFESIGIGREKLSLPLYGSKALSYKTNWTNWDIYFQKKESQRNESRLQRRN